MNHESNESFLTAEDLLLIDNLYITNHHSSLVKLFVRPQQLPILSISSIIRDKIFLPRKIFINCHNFQIFVLGAIYFFGNIPKTADNIVKMRF
jgi:hypothetical protein